VLFLEVRANQSGGGNWGRFWLLTAIVATVTLAWRLRKQASSAILLMLWSPVVFYSLTIAYGSVPLHVPMWWPFAIFNQRFGLELMPMFAVSAGVLVALISSQWPAVNEWKAGPVAAAVLILSSYIFVWIAKPVCWLEASRNWEMRRVLIRLLSWPLNSCLRNRHFDGSWRARRIMERLGFRCDESLTMRITGPGPGRPTRKDYGNSRGPIPANM